MQVFIQYLSGFDYAILHGIQSLGPAWKPVAHFLSNGVGSFWILLAVFFTVLVCIKKWRVAAELMVVTIISAVVLTLLKHFFAIERPYVIDPSLLHYDTETSFAFPSGHALMSLVILGWVALRHPKSHILLWGSIVLIILIGLSRIYLGVHYPSQVVAGWLFGGLLLIIFRSVGKKLWAPFNKSL